MQETASRPSWPVRRRPCWTWSTCNQGATGLSYLHGLRLRNLDLLDAAELKRLAGRSGSPKLMRAARNVVSLIEAEAREYETL